MTETTLYRRAFNNAELKDAITALPRGTFYGLFYTPSCCCFGLRKDKEFCDYRNDRINLAQVFEARLFNCNAELRWLRDPIGNGAGRAVYLSEQLEEQAKYEPLAGLSYQDHHYLLWGESWPGLQASEEWSCLASARIGTLWVPRSGLIQGQRVRLLAREYFGAAPGDAGIKHGNVVVREERLLGLVVAPTMPQAEAITTESANPPSKENMA